MDTTYWASTICHRFYLEISCIILFNPPNSLTRWLLVSPLYWEQESGKCLMNVTPIASSKAASHLKSLLEQERVWKKWMTTWRVGMWSTDSVHTHFTRSRHFSPSEKAWFKGRRGLLLLDVASWCLASYQSLILMLRVRTFGRAREIPMTPTSHLEIRSEHRLHGALDMSPAALNSNYYFQRHT